MPLICKGTAVKFKMIDGGARISARGAMLHDPTGKYWGKNSLLIGPFSRDGEPLGDKYKGPARDYLGRNHNAHVGSVELPPRGLDSWVTLGEVDVLYYRRPGTKAPGGFWHKFNAPRGAYKLMHAVKGKGKAILRKHGSFYRLDLPSNAVIDDRGVCWP